MVASDRISIFDFVLDTTIPDKGGSLTRMSLWWFRPSSPTGHNHVVSTDVPASVRRPGRRLRAAGDTPVRCVARGYLTEVGPARTTARPGEVCGIALGPVWNGSRLPEASSPRRPGRPQRHDGERVVRRRGQDRRRRAARRRAAGPLTLAVWPGRGRSRAAQDLSGRRKLEFGARRRHDSAPPTVTPTPRGSGPPTRVAPGAGAAVITTNRSSATGRSPRIGWDRASRRTPPPLPPGSSGAPDPVRRRHELLTGETVLSRGGRRTVVPRGPGRLRLPRRPREPGPRGESSLRRVEHVVGRPRAGRPGWTLKYGLRWMRTSTLPVPDPLGGDGTWRGVGRPRADLRSHPDRHDVTFAFAVPGARARRPRSRGPQRTRPYADLRRTAAITIARFVTQVGRLAATPSEPAE